MCVIHRVKQPPQHAWVCGSQDNWYSKVSVLVSGATTLRTSVTHPETDFPTVQGDSPGSQRNTRKHEHCSKIGEYLKNVATVVVDSSVQDVFYNRSMCRN